MRDLIESKIRTIYSDFVAIAEDRDCFCDLKCFTYKNGVAPNYADIFIQQLYHLRYLPAYVAEYFLMYKHFLRSNFLDGKLNVLSLGCGCGVDYWGLHFALKHMGLDATKVVAYYGIDLYDWNYRDKLGNENVHFTKKDLTQIDTIIASKCNILTFPKSLGELDDAGFQRLCDALSKIEFVEGKICILCSVMTESWSRNRDVQRLKQLAEVFERLGYRTNDPKDRYLLPDQAKGTGLQKIVPGCVYPDDIKDIMITLNKYCPKFLRNSKPCKNDCETTLPRWPILTIDYLKFAMLRFSR